MTNVLMGRLKRRTERWISRAWIRLRLAKPKSKLVRLGSEYCGWWVPEDIAAGAVAYCGGVGLDATFDFDLVDRKNLDVFSFDPTPSSITYMEEVNKGRVSFYPWGMMGKDQLTRFHAPFNLEHQSWFTENLHNTSDFFEAECFTVQSIMERLGHSHIDVLKIDIEGSWYEVLLNMLETNIYPPVICVEFDSPAPFSRVKAVTVKLEDAGYRAVVAKGDNVVFTR